MCNIIIVQPSITISNCILAKLNIQNSDMASLLNVGMFSYVMLEMFHELESGNYNNNNDDYDDADSSTKAGESSRLSEDDARSIQDVLFPKNNEQTSSSSSSSNDNAHGDTIINVTPTLCAICMGDFMAGDVVYSLPPCQHVFHKDCIVPWLTQYKGCCPLCMRNVKA